MAHRAQTSPNVARAPAGRGRSIGAVIVFSTWATAMGAMVLGWSREACDMPVRPAIAGEAAAATAGWRVRHTLPAGHELTAQIGDQLVARGPSPGVREEVIVTGGRARFVEERLRRAGWTVRLEAADAAEPTVEIVSPGEAVRWRGGFREEDFQTPGALMLDDVVLRRLARGEGATPFVPVGCATRLAATGTAAGENISK